MERQWDVLGIELARGGVTVGLVDGGVKFISDSVDYDTWANFGVRNDGQPLGNF